MVEGLRVVLEEGSGFRVGGRGMDPWLRLLGWEFRVLDLGFGHLGSWVLARRVQRFKMLDVSVQRCTLISLKDIR